MSITNTIEELEKLFGAGKKPTEAHFTRLINTYVAKDEDDNVGIGTLEPKNTLDVKGQVVIGEGYGGAETAPDNGLIVEGNVGIGHEFADEALHVNGNIKVEAGGLTIGGREVISNTGVWQGTLPDQDEQEGSALWTDGNNQVITNVKVGIGEASPSAELHVKGNVKIDEGNLELMGPNAGLTVNGLVTKQNVCFTADGISTISSEGENHRLILNEPLPQSQPDPFTLFANSIFKPDETLAGTYFFMVSITMAEVTEEAEQPEIEEEVEGKPEEKVEETEEESDQTEKETVPTDIGKPEADGAIFFSIAGNGNRLLTIREPNSCLHSTASLVHSFDGQTQLSLQASNGGIKIAQITLTGYRL